MTETETPRTRESGAADDWWAAIPEARDHPAEGEAATRLSNRPLAEGAAVPSRRGFLKVSGVLGGALALNLLQALSGVRLPFAGAAVGTQWPGCGGFSYSNSIICTPGNAYSYIYCGSDGWFKNGTFNGGNERYRPIKACNNRNAWRWVHAATQIRYRCADGEFSYYRSSGGWTAWQFKICAQWLGPA